MADQNIELEKEQKPDRKPKDIRRLRSEGERLISEFLAREKIHFVHEYPIAVRDEQNQIRIWYPDFFLPGLNIVIEYLGMKGKAEYEKNRKRTRVLNLLQI